MKMEPGGNPTAFTLRIDRKVSKVKDACVTMDDGRVEVQVVTGFNSNQDNEGRMLDVERKADLTTERIVILTAQSHDGLTGELDRWRYYSRALAAVTTETPPDLKS